MAAIVGALSPMYPVNARELRTAEADEVPLFSDEEVKEVAGLMKSGKSPGQDGVPSEVLNVILVLPTDTP